MLELFNKYLKDGKIYEALLVGQNMAYRKCDKESFVAYWDLLIKLAKDSNDIKMSLKYSDQLSALIAYFAENTELTNDIVELIVERQKQLNLLTVEINKIITEKENQFKVEKETYNEQSLDLIDRLADSLSSIEEDSDFEKRIEQIRQIDVNLEKDYLSSKQKKKYEELTKKCADIVSLKTKELELTFFFRHMKKLII